MRSCIPFSSLLVLILATYPVTQGRSAQDAAEAASRQPDASGRDHVLLIVIDDLNDWVGCLGGHPQARTPHLDALARRGILFTNAHCNGPICNPSRVSFFTGIRPSTSGIYLNQHDFRSSGSPIRDAVTLPEFFASHGYLTQGCGKLFHNTREKRAFQTYGPGSGQGPLPPARLNCPAEQSSSRLWDWGVYPAEEGEAYHDIASRHWAAERLGEPSEKPRLLACGFYRPHVPWYAPQRFFDLHPEQGVQLPPILDSDRDDLPSYALKLTDNPLPPPHSWFVQSGAWRQAVQSYLACISFTDENVGAIIQALDRGPYAHRTWIVLLSDHGFFLGEKQRWAKQSLWERATRVPLIVVPPRHRQAEFAPPGSQCHAAVELLGLFPTLAEACGLAPVPDQLEGSSWMPLLRNPDDAWTHIALTTHAGDNHAVRDRRFRYIRYADGSEELYDLEQDPHEWHNRAADLELAQIKRRMAAKLPASTASPPTAKPPSVKPPSAPRPTTPPFSDNVPPK